MRGQLVKTIHISEQVFCNLSVSFRSEKREYFTLETSRKLLIIRSDVRMNQVSVFGGFSNISVNKRTIDFWNDAATMWLIQH